MIGNTIMPISIIHIDTAAREHCPDLAVRTAQAYMKLAKPNTQRVAHLPIREALKALAEPKETTRDTDGTLSASMLGRPLRPHEARFDRAVFRAVRLASNIAAGIDTDLAAFDKRLRGRWDFELRETARQLSTIADALEARSHVGDADHLDREVVHG